MYDDVEKAQWDEIQKLRQLMRECIHQGDALLTEKHLDFDSWVTAHVKYAEARDRCIELVAVIDAASSARQKRVKKPERKVAGHHGKKSTDKED